MWPVINLIPFIGWNYSIQTGEYTEDALWQKFPDPVQGGFQLEPASISRVINHMTYYKFSAFIGWNYSIQTGEIILQSIFLK